MTAPMMPTIVAQLDKAFTLHKLWQAKDSAALLGEIGPRVRGVAAGGHARVDGALFDRLPKLEIVSSFGVGYDHVDAVEARKRGIVVTNTPDVLTEEVADTALGLLLNTVREFYRTEKHVREGKWLTGGYPLTKATLRNRRAGILGLGRIGKAIARRLEACGLSIAYHGRTKQNDVAWRYYPSLIEMARDVDTLVVVTPGGPGTRHLVNAQVLEALGPTGILINISRGTVVDEKALIAALQKGTIMSAGLDVFEDEPNVPKELLAMDHVVLWPHVGSASAHTRDAMAQLVVDNLVDWFAGKGARTPVPETPVKKR
jgi:lactate dehydrogenase-like 2-hydroxyacid dehydrogenase